MTRTSHMPALRPLRHAMRASCSGAGNPILAVLVCVAPVTVAAAQSVCPEGPVPPDADCTPCNAAWFIRATELDGVRHLLWATLPFDKNVVAAREVAPGKWDRTLVPLAGGVAPFTPTQAAIDGDLFAIAWGSKVDVLRAIDGIWTVEASLTSQLPNFGRCVAVSAAAGQPERIAVGTGVQPFSTGPDGAVLVFRKDAEWTLEQTVGPPSGATQPQTFGSQVAIDGTRLVVTCLCGAGGPNPKMLWIHELVDGSWTLLDGLAAPEWLPPLLGERVVLRGDQISARSRSWSSFLAAPVSVATFFKGSQGWMFGTSIISDSGLGQFAGDLSSIADGSEMLLGIANGGIFSQPAPSLVLTAGRFVRLANGAVIEDIDLHAPTPQGPDAIAMGVALAGSRSPWGALGHKTDAVGGPASLFSAAACPTVVVGDLDGDGVVNGTDLGLMLELWATDDLLADLDGSGVVGAGDLTILLAGWTG